MSTIDAHSTQFCFYCSLPHCHCSDNMENVWEKSQASSFIVHLLISSVCWIYNCEFLDTRWVNEILQTIKQIASSVDFVNYFIQSNGSPSESSLQWKIGYIWKHEIDQWILKIVYRVFGPRSSYAINRWLLIISRPLVYKNSILLRMQSKHSHEIN